MTRREVYEEMKETLGLVPTFFKTVPDTSLEQEWELFKRLQVDEGPIPGKYRELIGLGVAAATRCRYCTLFHTEMAKLAGATEEEIENAVHFAKATAGWSTYVNGLQADYETFKDEVLRACEYVRSRQPVLR